MSHRQEAGLSLQNLFMACVLRLREAITDSEPCRSGLEKRHGA